MNKVVFSSFLLVVQRLMARSLGVISTLVLARLLTPEDFGLIAKSMLVLWFVQAVASAGTEPYILQKSDVSNDDLNTAWTLDLSLKMGAYCLLFLIACLYYLVSKDFDVFIIVCALGLTLIFDSFKNPGVLRLKRAQEYRKIVSISVFGKLISVLIAVPAAFLLKNYWAIVIGQLVLAISGTALSYLISPFRPRFGLKNIKEQWLFSKWLIPQEVLGYFRNHVDTIIVGARFRSDELGAYNNMKYFSSIPMLQLLSPAVEPLHAELGKVQNDSREMKFQIDFTTFILAFLIAPLITIMYFGSESIIFLMLGEQWVPYYQVFGVLSLSTIPFVLISQANRMLMVKGMTRYIMLFEVAITAVMIFAMVSLNFERVHYLAWTKISVEFVLGVLYFAFSYRHCFLGGVFSSVSKFLYPTVIIFTFFFFFRESLPNFDSEILNIMFLIFLSSVSALAIIFAHFRFVLSSREKLLVKKLLRFR